MFKLFLSFSDNETWSPWTQCLACGDRGHRTRNRVVNICDITKSNCGKEKDQQLQDCGSYCSAGTVAGPGRCNCPPSLHQPCCTQSKITRKLSNTVMELTRDRMLISEFCRLDKLVPASVNVNRGNLVQVAR